MELLAKALRLDEESRKTSTGEVAAAALTGVAWALEQPGEWTAEDARPRAALAGRCDLRRASIEQQAFGLMLAGRTLTKHALPETGRRR